VPFGARPSALPFHIDAATVADPAAAGVLLDPPATIPAATLPPAGPPPASSTSGETSTMPAVKDYFADDMHAERRLIERARMAVPNPATPGTSAPSTAGTFVLQHTLDEVRLAAIRRVLRGSRGPGIVGHLPSFAVLLPTAIGADPTVNAALGTATEAIRGVYERLFVKLRIPGYDVSPFDLEDNTARRELLTFFRAAAAGTALPPYGSADLRVTLTSSALDAARDVLADAPLGGSAALAAIAGLLPRGGEGGLAALGSYVDQLAVELAETRSLTHDAFTSYLTMHRSNALDAARDAAVAALDSPGILAGG
jgi:hypothetical protein